ncbi:MAG TPA: hypothetical protein DD979_01145 [Gammaproteobacteria bacterium]|nr:hypothetical protein [Gammaproteobacteria bacterium]
MTYPRGDINSDALEQRLAKKASLKRKNNFLFKNREDGSVRDQTETLQRFTICCMTAQQSQTLINKQPPTSELKKQKPVGG